MTRAQKIAVGLSGGLFVVLGVLAAFLVGRESSSGTGQPAPAGSASTGGSGSTGPESQSQPKPPATVAAVAYGGGPVTGGWRTRIAITFAGAAPKLTAAPGPGAGTYRLTFGRRVRLPQSVLQAASADATTYLMSPTWNGSAQTLDVAVTGLADAITATAAGSAGNTAYFDVVRPAVERSHDCLTLEKPAPYTGIFGTTAAQGTESAFEGVFTLVVRGGGRQTKKVVHAAGTPSSFFRTDIEPPLERQPVAGTVVAYQLSAKDGTPQCVLQIPVWLSPGG